MSNHPLFQLTLLRIREFVREPEALFWSMVFPITLAAGLGIAFRNQPAAVLDVIGKRGEKLEGALVRRNGDTRTIRYATTFQVGLAANPELDRVAREQAKMSQTRWWKSQCNEICDNAEFFERARGRSFSKPDCLRTCVSNPPAPQL